MEQQELLNELRANGINLPENTICELGRWGVQFAAKETDKEKIEKSFTTMFGSNVDFYYDTDIRGDFKGNRINHGIMGSYTPNDLAQYTRTIIAAELLKNWEVACQIINKYIKK